MNHMLKVLTTASILTMIAIPVVASAQDVATPIQYGQESTIKIVPGTMGQITDFVNDKTGKFITVTGRGLDFADQSEIILSITKDTKIIDSNGNRVPLKTIIDEKKVVKAFYDAKITKSIPAIGTALTLIVKDQSFTGMNGTVSEVTDSGITVTGKDIYSKLEDTIVLHFDDHAQIMSQDGKTIEASSIKPGMSVQAFYGPAVTMSLPPQSTTNYVVVNTTAEETIPAKAPGTTGVITNIQDNKVTVIGSPMEQGGVNYVILKVDDKTQIVDQNGNSLTQDALKSDLQVDAYYGEVMTMIYPAQTHADKIVVKEAHTHKIEGTIVESDHTAKGQVYVNVGSDSTLTNDVILNMTEDTTVVGDMGGTALEAGMKIVAYHSPMMTKSLPGITNAEIVVVTSGNEVVPQ